MDPYELIILDDQLEYTDKEVHQILQNGMKFKGTTNNLPKPISAFGIVGMLNTYRSFTSFTLRSFIIEAIFGVRFRRTLCDRKIKQAASVLVARGHRPYSNCNSRPLKRASAI